MRSVCISDLNFDQLIGREWLAVNGIGGYACSTLCGLNTRKYHGLLVAAMSPPVRRMVLLSHVEETVWTHSGAEYALGNNEYPGTIFPRGYTHLRAFSADPFPRWAYQGDGFTIEKSLQLLRGENTACLSYTLLAGDKPVTLEIKALLALRGIHELMYQWNSRLAAETSRAGLVRIPASSRTPEVFFAHDGEFRSEPHWHLNAIYRREEERGYSGLEDLWKPGTFRWTLAPGQTANLACATEPLELNRVLADLQSAREEQDRQTAIISSEADSRLDMLVREAESFIVTGAIETGTVVTGTGGSAESSTDRSVSVIPQYPWSAPGAREALVGFCGLFLTTGRIEQGRSLLVSLASQMRGGMIPTAFSEDGSSPTYDGADVSLWFINAAGELFSQTDDEATAARIFPAIQEIIETYASGKGQALLVDEDGLIGARIGTEPRTWMDAHVGNWIVTPRSGRTVELNALWFNALMTAARLASKLGKTFLASDWQRRADKVGTAFNRRFWNETLNCCFDLIDAPDASVRPNQLFAASLPHPVLPPERQRAVVDRVRRELQTPFGIRTLGRLEPGYQGKYAGNVVARDGAQHQGSVYPWLLGPLASAYLRSHGRDEFSRAAVMEWIEPCLQFMEGDGLGHLCELFDGDDPGTGRGAIASALGTAEILRVYAREILGVSMVRGTPRPASKSSQPQVAGLSRP